MNIVLNNREEWIEQDNLTINQLIQYKNFTFRLLVTKLNGNLVKKDQRDDFIVQDGDHVEIMHLISGG
jgi:sulfur carrier protein